MIKIFVCDSNALRKNFKADLSAPENFSSINMKILEYTLQLQHRSSSLELHEALFERE